MMSEWNETTSKIIITANLKVALQILKKQVDNSVSKNPRLLNYYNNLLPL